MLKKEQDLIVFGLGLGLLIPFVIMMHSTHHGLKPLSFIIVVAAVLYILAKAIKWKTPYFLVLAVIVFRFFTGEVKHEPGILSYVFLGFAALSIIYTFINVRLLEPVYEYWMKGAHFMGSVITGAVLGILYYCVFGAAGIVLRLIKKDLLDRSIDKQIASYWQKREEPFNKETYKRQF